MCRKYKRPPHMGFAANPISQPKTEYLICQILIFRSELESHRTFGLSFLWYLAEFTASMLAYFLPSGDLQLRLIFDEEIS
jgi:hypothetical protein